MSPVELLRPLLGGILIGLSASFLLWSVGRIAGVTGIMSGSMTPGASHQGYRVGFLVGLLVAGTAAHVFIAGAPRPSSFQVPLPFIVMAGVLVGIGARLAGGCTSGHSVCGVSRLNPRSVVATTLFIAAGALSVLVLRQLFGVAT